MKECTTNNNLIQELFLAEVQSSWVVGFKVEVVCGIRNAERTLDYVKSGWRKEGWKEQCIMNLNSVIQTFVHRLWVTQFTLIQVCVCLGLL